MDLNFKLLIIYPFYSNGYVMCQNMVFLIRFIVGYHSNVFYNDSKFW